MISINNKVIIVLIAFFIIFASFVLYTFLTDDSDDKFMQELSLHQKIDEQQIESVRMSKVVLEKSSSKQIEFELNLTQIQKIVSHFNSISQDSIQSIDAVNPSIISGIAIKMKDRSEIRIQYDKKNIYVSRSEVKYMIDDIEFKEIFDKELKNDH